MKNNRQKIENKSWFSEKNTEKPLIRLIKEKRREQTSKFSNLCEKSKLLERQKLLTLTQTIPTSSMEIKFGNKNFLTKKTVSPNSFTS